MFLFIWLEIFIWKIYIFFYFDSYLRPGFPNGYWRKLEPFSQTVNVKLLKKKEFEELYELLNTEYVKNNLIFKKSKDPQEKGFSDQESSS